MRLHLCLPLLLAAATTTAPAQINSTQTSPAPSYPNFVTDAQIPIPASDGFSDPQGLAVAPGGIVYVADTGNHRLLQISAAGVQTSVSFGQFGPAIQTPTGVALDGGGSLYVTDTATNRLIKLPTRGNAITIIAAPVLDRPTAVATDPLGNLAVVNSGNNSITMRRAGNAAAPLNTGSTVLVTPQAVAFDNQGTLYVADAGNSITPPAIYRFPKGGGTGVSLTPAGYLLKSVTGLALDTARNLYILDGGDDQLIEVPATGATPFLIPASSFKSPSGLALDILGNLYVSDSASNTLNKFAYGNAADYGSLAVGTQGATYTYNFAFYTPTLITASQAIGGGSNTIEYLRQPGGTCAGKTYYPTVSSTGLTLPSTCILRYSFLPRQVGGRQGAVQLVTSNGTESQLTTGIGLGAQLAVLNGAVTLKLPTYYISSIIVNAADTYLYFSAQGGTYKAPIAGGNPVLLSTDTGLLALNGAEDLFIFNGQTVTKVPADGSAPSVLSIPGLIKPQSITIDPNGALYITDLGPGDPNSDFFNPAGFVLRVSEFGEVSKVLPGDWVQPTFTATDHEGNIFVEDGYQQNVYGLYTQNGLYTLSGPGPQIGGLLGALPINLVADTSDTLYYWDMTDGYQGLAYSSYVPGPILISDVGEYQLPLFTIPGVPNPNTSGPIFPFIVPTGNQTLAISLSGKIYAANGAGPGVFLVDRTLGSTPASAFNATYAAQIGNYNLGNPQTVYVFNIGNQNLTFTDPTRTFTESGNGIGSFTIAPSTLYGSKSCTPGFVILPGGYCALTVTALNPLGPGTLVTDTLQFLTNAPNNNNVRYRITGYAATPATK